MGRSHTIHGQLGYQENNALAIIDVRAATVTKVVGLGIKDHSLVEAKKLDLYEFPSAALPSIGATAAGQDLFLGRFSGLHFEGIDPRTGHYKFVTHTDRGPNAEPTDIERPSGPECRRLLSGAKGRSSDADRSANARRHQI